MRWWKKISRKFTRNQWITIFGIAVPAIIAVVSIVVSIVTAPPTIPTSTSTQGFQPLRIISPQDGSSISQGITVQGDSGKELPVGQHLWVVVEYGMEWWPQTNEVKLSYSSVTQKYGFSVIAQVGNETDFGKTFVVRAILVDSTINQRFENWFQVGQTTGSWPGLPQVDINHLGQVVLCDYVTLTRKGA